MSAREKLPPKGRENASELRERVDRTIMALKDTYPNATMMLQWDSPFQLLVAVILSAQCTDERVNQVTPTLFAAFPTAHAMALASQEDVEQIIRPTGFYRRKAQHIRSTAIRIVDEHDGLVPSSVEEISLLPGAARKTANVVVAECFPENSDGIAVDTHVQRIVRRLGWTRSWTTDQIELDLKRLIKRKNWNEVTHLLIAHGRSVCKAPTPQCHKCPPKIAGNCATYKRKTTVSQ